jgi:beta-glucosidase
VHFINNHQIYSQFIKTIQITRVIIITFIFNILSFSLMMPQINNSQINFPFPQENLLHQLANVGKPIVLVLLNGSALAINWEAENIPAIIEAWYPRQAAGDALADVLFGDYNPSGRLPITLYRSVDQLPAFNNYSMNGRTYRYFNDEPLYPFGYRMSYTKFKYSNLKAPDRVNVGEKFNVSVEVQNTGKIKGDEVCNFI